MILLSFDIEEFDMPIEYGKDISFQDQLNISTIGTTIILDLLKKKDVKATFFCTANFAIHVPHLIHRMIAEGHEVGSHGYYHSDFKKEHLLQSRVVLEKLSGQAVVGYRMARMMPVNEQEIAKAGYLYNTSMNPTWIPGRYNNLSKSRTYFKLNKVLQIPASVSPLLRIPLFWLSFHNFPLRFYKWLCKKTYQADGYLNLYFHPWEFTDLDDKDRLGLPGYVVKNSGTKMAERSEALIDWMKKCNYPFGTFKDLIKTID